MIDTSPNCKDCKDCKHYCAVTVFELCLHAESTYTAAGKIDQHTVGHMRRFRCGPQAALFEPRGSNA